MNSRVFVLIFLVAVFGAGCASTGKVDQTQQKARYDISINKIAKTLEVKSGQVLVSSFKAPAACNDAELGGAWWSQDGKELLMSEICGSDSYLYYLNSETGSETGKTFFVSKILYDVSVSGNKLAFMSTSPKNSSLTVTDLKGDNQVTLVSIDEGKTPAGDLPMIVKTAKFSPKGEKLYYYFIKIGDLMADNGKTPIEDHAEVFDFVRNKKSELQDMGNKFLDSWQDENHFVTKDKKLHQVD